MFKFKESYRGLWEKQNIELDELTKKCQDLEDSKNKEIEDLKKELYNAKLINATKNDAISELKKSISLINQSMDIFVEKINKTNEEYSASVEKIANQVITSYNDRLKELGTSKGGLTKSANKLAAEKMELKNENTNLRNLIKRMQYENSRKLTPPTIQELENYKLYRNKKGKIK